MTSKVVPRIEIRDSTATVTVNLWLWGDHTGDSGSSVASATSTFSPEIPLAP